MKHRRVGKTLDRRSSARRALLRGLATSVILYEHCNTTLAKAKAVRPLVERLITKGKVKSLTSRRQLNAVLMSENAVNKVLEELGPRYATRPGGYTRIIKLGTRQGDGAEIAQIQLVK
ncbi:50S ribosomal protein L17 [Candidatus Uhrbacteria bacterium]|nr:MAG: 50S ribosomal protein L17 [Candidatus Uhrbacteria bacterium]